MLARPLPLVLVIAAACSSAEPAPGGGGSASASVPSLVAIARDTGGAPRMLMGLGRDPSPSSAASPIERARAHLARHAAALGSTPAELSALEVARVTDTGRGGAVTTFRRRVAGLEVVGSDVRVLTRPDGSLAMVSGLPPPPARERPRFALSAAQAFARSLGAELGRSVRAADLTPGGDAPGGYRTFRAPGVPLLDPCRIRPVLTATGGALVTAYQVEILRRDETGRPRGGEYLVDAGTGAILRQRRLENDASFQYRVWASAGDRRPHDGPLADVTPHPTGEPDGTEPAPTAPSLVAMEAFNQPNDPWLPAGATTTSGNNVDAYADIGGGDGFDAGTDVRATTTDTRVFDRSYNLGNTPGTTAQRMAAVVHLFYVNNWMHDWWYDSGFDEAAGNAQASNLGRGGVEGDVLLAEAQDFSGFENANMLTPADGVSPRMQMFLFRGTPERDASLDSAIVAHEWGHYLHHRLQSCGTAMCAALSEGWADFVALHMLMRQGDAANGTYGMGTYAAFDTVSELGGDAAYSGIRRAPYTRNKTRNGLSFRHISAGEPLPDHPIFELSPDNAESHNAGEIWALMLFEAYQQLLDRARAGDYSFDEARRRMSDYAVAGLALSPADSTYLETRDAILAVAAAADPLDAQALAAGFARRGAGSCAISPPADSVDFIGVTEDVDLSPRLAITDVSVDDSVASCDEDGFLDGEESGVVRVAIGNPGAGELAGAEVTVASASDGVSFPDGGTASVPTIAPYGSGEVAIPVTLAAREDIGEITVTVDSSAPGSCEASAAAELTTRVHVDEVANVARVDDVESETTTWTATGAAEGEVWKRRIDEGANHVWHAEDAGFPTDAQLVSPAVTVSATGSLVLAFQHRYDFEYDGTYWDGAVIEITDDGGATWRDVSEFGNPGYVGVITDESGNVLGNRMAFAGQSAGYPALQTGGVDLGTSFAGKTVQFRFRVGTDAAVGATGWDIDDIEIEGIEETPFGQVNADDGAGCENLGEPDAGSDGGDGDGDDEDGGCGCRAGGREASALWLVALAALIVRRRKRRRG
ncbi:MAG TPA: M36 family metallopeptidase [Kofleriaceae bacterium]|nr:M36 family metallopeptidase [Kofleriaceae bacterium]